MQPLIKKKNILFNRSVELIEENHQQITEQFMNDLLKNPDTDAYRVIDKYTVYEFSDMIYRDLSKWIAREYPKKKIEERYIKMAKDRYEMGIPFPQVHKAFVLMKRHLWLFVMDKLYDDKVAYMEALELNNRVTLYFDRAVFFVLKGYYELIHKYGIK